MYSPDTRYGAPKPAVQYGAPKRAVMKLQMSLPNCMGSRSRTFRNLSRHCSRCGPAGWHSWRVRASSAVHQKTLINGVRGLPCVRRAYLTEQGWVEGALKSVEYALWEMSAAGHRQQSVDRFHMDAADYEAYISV